MKIWLTLLLTVVCLAGFGQDGGVRQRYKVKAKDTIYGVARKFNVSVDELMNANPEMRQAGYVLKADAYVLIPYHKAMPAASAKTKAGGAATSLARADGRAHKASAGLPFSGRKVRVGVMLPLHNVDGDGRRMTEYYRGLLMACDSLRAQGLSVDVHAWNVDIDANIFKVLGDPAAARCDIIFGPLYTKQVRGLAEFCKARDIRLVIPFSISGDDVSLYSQIYQVYQSKERLNNSAVESFLKTFPKAHPVFIDCNDKLSKKGTFTMALRTRLESRNRSYGITNLNSSDDAFAKQFSRTDDNVVVLNTGRSPELTLALNKLELLRATHPWIKVSLYGYTEWLMYLSLDAARFHAMDTYIPSTFFYNPTDPRTQALEASYRRWFHAGMQQALPRFAITGYDQGQFFLRGLATYGKQFKGLKTQSSYRPLQTPFVFKQISTAGMQNDFFQLIHFQPDGNIVGLSY